MGAYSPAVTRSARTLRLIDALCTAVLTSKHTPLCFMLRPVHTHTLAVTQQVTSLAESSPTVCD